MCRECWSDTLNAHICILYLFLHTFRQSEFVSSTCFFFILRQYGSCARWFCGIFSDKAKRDNSYRVKSGLCPRSCGNKYPTTTYAEITRNDSTNVPRVCKTRAYAIRRAANISDKVDRSGLRVLFRHSSHVSQTNILKCGEWLVFYSFCNWRIKWRLLFRDQFRASRSKCHKRDRNVSSCN